MITIKRTISADSALNHLGHLKEFVDTIYGTRALNNINLIKVSLHSNISFLQKPQLHKVLISGYFREKDMTHYA